MTHAEKIADIRSRAEEFNPGSKSEAAGRWQDVAYLLRLIDLANELAAAILATVDNPGGDDVVRFQETCVKLQAYLNGPSDDEAECNG